jgi:tetratricopeptide (TPR) repeat protein
MVNRTTEQQNNGMMNLKTIMKTLLTLWLCLGLFSGLMADTWHANYNKAVKAVKKEQWQQAVKYLNDALKERNTPKLKARTVGLRFVDYLPYFHLGLAHYKSGRFRDAQSALEQSLEHGVVKKRGGLHDRLNLMLLDCREKLKPKPQAAAVTATPAKETQTAQPEPKPVEPKPQPVTPVQKPKEKAEKPVKSGPGAVTRLIEEGKRLYRGGKWQAAKEKFSAVLQLESSHPVAAQWVKDIDHYIGVRHLNSGIEDYFSGKRKQGEQSFRKAVRQLAGENRGVRGLVTAHQFLAVLLIETFYLEGGESGGLLQEARQHIRTIKSLQPGFQLEKKYFSPKVQKVFSRD